MRTLLPCRRAVFLSATLVILGFLAPRADAQWTFIRGDGNGDGSTNIADAVFTLDHLFNMGPAPCRDALDTNDDGGLNIADAVFLLDVLFGGSGAMPPPPIGTCGEDPTADSIECLGPLPGCPPASCSDNNDCPGGEYCAKAIGDCNGSGLCEAMPLMCPVVIDPVCGCDGITYDNACLAAQSGVNVDFDGPCIAGCTSNTQCPPDEYCAKAVGDCNGVGSCMVMPQFCPAIFDPQCGCDGATYSNACYAAASGVNVEHQGPCP